MRTLFGGKNAAKRLRKRTSLRPQPARRFSLHGLEHLETRSMMTAAPFVGPLLPEQPADGQIAVAMTSTLEAQPLASAESAADAINAFALDLYKLLQSNEGGSGNILISPFSVATVLAMAYPGSRGATADQLADALHLSGDAAADAADFGALLSDLNGLDQSYLTLSIAEALWSQQGSPLLPQFLETINGAFNGGLHEVDYEHQPEQARLAINQWVAEHTKDKIVDLLPPGSIDNLTRLVLTNAIYFKGKWSNPFSASSTYEAPFTLAGGAVEQAPTMHETSYYRYMERDGFQVVELPYSGNRLAMDVLLPGKSSGANGLSVGRLPSDWSSWFADMEFREVSVSLPKFTMTTDFGLSEQLKALGIVDAFSSAADFSGISNAEPIQFTNLLHKAFIAVDESGAEAAASSGLIMGTTSVYNPPPPIPFNADHPFLFAIRDKLTGAVLFMGQVADPLSESKDSAAPGIKAAHAPDANGDGMVTPLDALRVINYMIRHSPQEESASLAAIEPAPDLNEDGVVSPLDLLVIYNDLARKSAPLQPIRIQPIQPIEQITWGTIVYDPGGYVVLDTYLPDWLNGAEVRST